MVRFLLGIFMLVGCERAEIEEVVQGEIEEFSGTDLTQDNPDLIVSVSVDQSWSGGYCNLVSVTNSGSEEIDWEIRLFVDGRISNYWNVEIDYAFDAAVQFYGIDSNSQLSPSETVDFGFCAER